MVRSIVLNCGPEVIVKLMTKSKEAVYTPGLDIAQTDAKCIALLHNAEEMLNFTRGEEKQLEKVRSFAPSYRIRLALLVQSDVTRDRCSKRSPTRA